MNGHQGLKPTDVVGPPTDVVGPPTDVGGSPHSPQVKMAFSLEEAPCGSTGFFTFAHAPPEGGSKVGELAFVGVKA